MAVVHAVQFESGGLVLITFEGINLAAVTDAEQKFLQTVRDAVKQLDRAQSAERPSVTEPGAKA